MPETTPYDGPIEEGMTFLWEPFAPWATLHVRVTKIRDNGEQVWIHAKEWEPVTPYAVQGDYTGPTQINEEERFREAVMLVPVAVDATTGG